MKRLGQVGRPMAEKALRDWGGDVVEINRATEGHALYFIALAVLERHNLVAACRIDPAKRVSRRPLLLAGDVVNQLDVLPVQLQHRRN